MQTKKETILVPTTTLAGPPTPLEMKNTMAMKVLTRKGAAWDLM
jgi:hypothetical protein